VAEIPPSWSTVPRKSKRRRPWRGRRTRFIPPITLFTTGIQMAESVSSTSDEMRTLPSDDEPEMPADLWGVVMDHGVGQNGATRRRKMGTIRRALVGATAGGWIVRHCDGGRHWEWRGGCFATRLQT
jgi:hypothetical protein